MNDKKINMRLFFPAAYRRHGVAICSVNDTSCLVLFFFFSSLGIDLTRLHSFKKCQGPPRLPPSLLYGLELHLVKRGREKERNRQFLQTVCIVGDSVECLC